MGFDNDLILSSSPLPRYYFCPVCGLLVYPHEALQSPCNHLFCKPCLTKVVTTTCPYDNCLVTEAYSKPLVESNKTLAETIGKIVVYCLYYRRGCPWQGSLSECVTHSFGCVFGNSPILCNPFGIQPMHQQLEEHAQPCPYQQTGIQYQQPQVSQALPSRVSTHQQPQSHGHASAVGQFQNPGQFNPPHQFYHASTPCYDVQYQQPQVSQPLPQPHLTQSHGQSQSHMYIQHPVVDQFQNPGQVNLPQQFYHSPTPYYEVQYQQPHPSQVSSHLPQVPVHHQPLPQPHSTYFEQPQQLTQSHGHMYIQAPAQFPNQGQMNPQQQFVATPWHPPAYGATSYHSYPQSQHHQQVQYPHQQYQPVQMQVQLPQPPSMCPPPAMFRNQQQPPILPSPGQVNNASAAQPLHAPSQAQQSGGPPFDRENQMSSKRKRDDISVTLSSSSTRDQRYISNFFINIRSKEDDIIDIFYSYTNHGEAFVGTLLEFPNREDALNFIVDHKGFENERILTPELAILSLDKDTNRFLFFPKRVRNFVSWLRENKITWMNDENLVLSMIRDILKGLEYLFSKKNRIHGNLANGLCIDDNHRVFIWKIPKHSTDVHQKQDLSQLLTLLLWIVEGR